MQRAMIVGAPARCPRLAQLRSEARPGASVAIRPRTLLARAEPTGDGGSSSGSGGQPDKFESLFASELKRRGLASTDGGDDAAPSAPSASSTSQGAQGAAPSGTNPFASASSAAPGGSTTRTRARAPPPPRAADNIDDDQRARSMGMVNEGLEGLFPRAKLLLQLGGSVFLGFLPFMLAFSLLFTGIYSVFGDSFVHGGRTGSGPPAYIDPDVLLSEGTVDPMVPYSSSPYAAPDLR